MINSELFSAVLIGNIAMFYQDGVIIHKVSLSQNLLMLIVPEESIRYHNSDVIKSPEDYVRRIKETWINLGLFTSPNPTVKFTTYKENWTEEKAKINYNKNYPLLRKQCLEVMMS